WDSLVHDLANRSFICGFDRSLSSIGLRFETDPHSGDLLLRTGSPESCIQFATLLQESPKLLVRAEDRRKSRTEAVVDLSPPGEEGDIDLPLTFFTGRSWCEWMRLEPMDAESPTIIPELKLAVSRWLLPHLSWNSELDTLTI
ncbi:MAG TPA: hypothetical protein DDW68_04675, partial [Verrucomicrobiales bacterium]|nr:hypothetical protein [Verrucomicrobiales bacterium]